MADPIPFHASSPEGDPFQAPATVESLASICHDIAEADTRFAERLKPRTRAAYDWDDFNGVFYSASVGARHEYKEDEEGGNLYEEPLYLGCSYELGLEIGYELEPEIIPAELLVYLRDNDHELPADINKLTVTYGVEMEISPANQLSWHAVRFYDIEYVTETIDDASMELVADAGTVPVDYDEIGMEVSRLSHMRVALKQGSQESTPFRAETQPASEETEEEMFARLVDRFIESCAADPQGESLQRALVITDMVKTRSEGNFDLAGVFPPEVLELINEG